MRTAQRKVTTLDTNGYTPSTFGKVPITGKFVIAHLPELDMVKVPKAMSDRKDGQFPFVGEYNAVSQGGSRWIWEDSQPVLVPVGNEVRNDEWLEQGSPPIKEAQRGLNLEDLTQPGKGSIGMAEINDAYHDENQSEDVDLHLGAAEDENVGEGRSPVDIALSQASSYDGYVRKLRQKLQHMRSPAYGKQNGGFLYGHEKEVAEEITYYTKLRDEAMAKAERLDKEFGVEEACVEAPYSESYGTMGTRFEDDKKYNIVKGAQLYAGWGTTEDQTLFDFEAAPVRNIDVLDGYYVFDMYDETTGRWASLESMDEPELVGITDSLSKSAGKDFMAKINEEINALYEDGLQDVDVKQAILLRYGRDVLHAVFDGAK